MALTNAQRQDRHRRKRKLAASDVGFLTRLFGPEIPPEADDMFDVAKAVSSRGAASAESAAIQALVSSVIHDGIGGGFVGGWYRRECDGVVTIAVCRIRAVEKVAA